ncbi:MAG: RsmB/NOP family class I SAM-dependent RNA methyltransferase [Gemmatimonadota bacterium]
MRARAGAPRRRALEILLDVRAGARADESLDRRARDLDRRDRAFVMELAYGAIRWRGRIDAHLDPLLDRGLASLPPEVVSILELGTYQILFMDRVPVWSAVDESVRLAQEALPRPTSTWAPGLVNGVLRNLARRGDDLPLPGGDAASERLALLHSHPVWMVERWVERLGMDATAALLERNNRPPSLHLAVDPRTTTAAAVVDEIRRAGIDARIHPDHPGAVVVEGGVRPEELPGWGAGRIWVQDAGAQWVTALADPPADRPFLDACAAPGGKLIAFLAGHPSARALAVDRDPARLARVRENLDRMDLERAWPVAADARVLPTGASFPLVVVDAPCTGTGVLGRRPDARWRRDPGDPVRFAAFQLGLLEGLADRVEPSGVLLYATCSLEPEENAGVVEAFQARRADFRVDPAGARIPEALRDGPFLATRPWEMNLDGMFAARLVRRPA